MSALARLFAINHQLMRHSIISHFIAPYSRFFKTLSLLNPYRKTSHRAESLRLCLEHLGPIFVKFGQVLSTRPDLFDADIIEELSKLQDQVPGFSGQHVTSILEKAYQSPLSESFSYFDATPLAAASVAQVHAATLHSGEQVVVKVIRPNIKGTIKKDIRLMKWLARLSTKLWKPAKRLKPLALVCEFEKTILDELDMMREAANCSQLKRNFENSTILKVPTVYWPYCRQNILVSERIHGVTISDIATLKQQRVNMKVLAERGVEIFFTQVFRDRFFHADMHPGNLFVDITDPNNPTYCGVDFGIMGTLTPNDQRYLADNVMAFFNRDYLKVAKLHVESAWVKQDVRLDEFESAIRTVCEPIFEKPINEVSFGQLLLRLFQTAERFEMTVQPQLLLLQKTLLNVEGLGRELYPQLDLWQTAKPLLEKFIEEQRSPIRLLKQLASHLLNTVSRL